MISYFGIDYGAYTPPETLDYDLLERCGVMWHGIGVTGNPWVVRHILQAKQHGVPNISVYVIPRDWTWPGDMAMHAAIAQFGLVFPPTGRKGLNEEPDVILDVESNRQYAPAGTLEQNRDWIRQARKVAEDHGYSVGKYSNRNAWNALTGPDGAFDAEMGDLPNHDACYDNLPFSGFSGPWGGRLTPLINQFASTGLAGMNLDLNWIEKETRMMTDEQITEALGNILGTLNAFGKRVDFLGAEVYKSVTNRDAQVRLEMEYIYKAAGQPVP